MSTLQMIPTSKIKPGDNPRGEIDEGSDAFKEFCGSIETYGVKQSILVGPANGDGKHAVIAGHRRFAAAVKVGLSELPAMVEENPDGAELTLALIENVQRQDLSPVAEARAIHQLREQHGLTQEKAAETLNKSVRWARERERLLNMPEKTQQAYDDGALPLESLATVEKLAKQAPAAAEALAEAAAEDDTVKAAINGDRVSDALSTVIVDAAEDLEKDGTSKLGCFAFVGDDHYRGRVTYEALVLAGPAHDQLKAIKDAVGEWKGLEKDLKKLDTWAHAGSPPEEMWFDQADLEAAETFGCLLTIDNANYVTDATWLADRFLQAAQATVRNLAKKVSAVAARKSSSKNGKEKGSKEAEQAAKEERRRIREAEQAAREAARANNLELGQRAQRELRAPKLSLEEAKVFALLAVTAGGGEIGAAFSYCYHDYQEEQQLKNGSTKVSYATGKGAPRQDLIASIKAAKKPEEALGLALRAMVLGKYSDPEAVVPSNRPGAWWVPGQSYEDRQDLSDIDGLLETIAEKRGVLPDEVRQAQEAQRQEEGEEAELGLLKSVKGSRAKIGIAHDALLEVWRVTPATIEAAVSRRHLKAHENDGATTYTLLGAGTKRLEKLKAAEKERQAS